MGTKLDPGRFDCYAAAAPEEPYFMLLARDRDAAALVNLWACMRRLRQDPKDAEKIAEAEQCANDMVAWLIEHKGQDPNGVKTLAQALALLAEMVGAVVTIEQEPQQPLAMGNYRHAVTVRPKR